MIAAAATQFPELVELAIASENYAQGLIFALLFIFIIITLVMLALGSLSFAVGIWLIKGKTRGLVLAIVFAVLDLIWIPIGTIIGVLSLMYLLRPEVKEHFRAARTDA
jgi:hypothetical protein